MIDTDLTLRTPELVSALVTNLEKEVETLETPKQAKHLRDRAQLIKEIAHKIGAALDVQNRAAVIYLLATASAGGMYQDADTQRGPSSSATAKQEVMDALGGIAKTTIHQWIRLHNYVSANRYDFQRVAGFLRSNGYEITMQAFLDRAGVMEDLPGASDAVRRMDARMPIRRRPVLETVIRLEQRGGNTWQELSYSLHLQPGEEEEAVNLWDLDKDVLAATLQQRSNEHARQRREQAAVEVARNAADELSKRLFTTIDTIPFAAVVFIGQTIDDDGYDLIKKLARRIQDIRHILVAAPYSADFVMSSYEGHITARLGLHRWHPIVIGCKPRGDKGVLSSWRVVNWFYNVDAGPPPPIHTMIPIGEGSEFAALARHVLPHLLTEGEAAMAYRDRGDFLAGAIQADRTACGLYTTETDCAIAYTKMKEAQDALALD